MTDINQKLMPAISAHFSIGSMNEMYSMNEGWADYGGGKRRWVHPGSQGSP